MRTRTRLAYSEVFKQRIDAHSKISAGTLNVSGQLAARDFAKLPTTQVAANSHTYSTMRTALAALISHNGCFGITNGVEWFASEKVDVHGASALRWGNPDNQVELIGRLNSILEVSPAFHAGAGVRMIQMLGGNSLAVLRTSAGGGSGGSVLFCQSLCIGGESVSWRPGV